MRETQTLERSYDSIRHSVQPIDEKSESVLSPSWEEMTSPVTATRSRARADSDPIWVSFNSKKKRKESRLRFDIAGVAVPQCTTTS